jgi:hypothetical protein
MPESQMPKRMLRGRIHSRRKKGRPKKRWMDSVTVDLRVMGVRGWRSIAADRERDGEALSKRPKPIKGCSACEEEEEEESAGLSSKGSHQQRIQYRC